MIKRMVDEEEEEKMIRKNGGNEKKLAGSLMSIHKSVKD